MICDKFEAEDREKQILCRVKESIKEWEQKTKEIWTYDPSQALTIEKVLKHFKFCITPCPYCNSYETVRLPFCKVECSCKRIYHFREIINKYDNKDVKSKRIKKVNERIVQIKNPKSGRYIKIDKSVGRIISY